MLFPRYLPRLLLLLAVFSLFALPSFAGEQWSFPGASPQAAKGKKGDAPPRPRPKPGPQEGGDDD